MKTTLSSWLHPKSNFEGQLAIDKALENIRDSKEMFENKEVNLSR